MNEQNYVAPSIEELLLTVEAGFANSFETPGPATDDGFEDTY